MEYKLRKEEFTLSKEDTISDFQERSMSGILITVVPQVIDDSVSMASLIFINKLNLIVSISEVGKLNPDTAGDIEIIGLGLAEMANELHARFISNSGREVALFSLILPILINQFKLKPNNMNIRD